MPTRCNRLVFLLQNLLFAQHVSGTIMPIIRSSRLIQMVAACVTWRFGLQVVGLVWSCGLCVRFAGRCSLRNINKCIFFWGGGGWLESQYESTSRHYARSTLRSEYRQGRLEIPVNVNKGGAIQFGSKPHANGQPGRPRPRWKNNMEMHSSDTNTKDVIWGVKDHVRNPVLCHQYWSY